MQTCMHACRVLRTAAVPPCEAFRALSLVRSSKATTPSAQQSAAALAGTASAPEAAESMFSGEVYSSVATGGTGQPMVQARSKSASVHRFSSRR